jgi:hypothetical protein
MLTAIEHLHEGTTYVMLAGRIFIKDSGNSTHVATYQLIMQNIADFIAKSKKLAATHAALIAEPNRNPGLPWHGSHTRATYLPHGSSENQ